MTVGESSPKGNFENHIEIQKALNIKQLKLLRSQNNAPNQGIAMPHLGTSGVCIRPQQNTRQNYGQNYFIGNSAQKQGQTLEIRVVWQTCP